MNLKRKVINHFTYASEMYSKRKGFIHEQDPIILNFIKETCTTNSKVLEVGGGSGYMLDLIASETGIKHLYNCEIILEVYSEQANKDINLIGGNALNLPFKDCSFDYLIIKNLLHHLVDGTRKKSKENAKRAIEEITRVIRDEGYIIVLEQYNNHKLFSSVVFYITLFSSLFNISFKSFEWNKNVIVSFLTPEEIKTLVPNNIVIERLEINRVKVPTRFKLTLIMSRIGRVLLIGKKCGKDNEW